MPNLSLLFHALLWLIALNILDLIVAFLIWREYQVRKVSRAVQLPAQQ
jgi:uncharacterized membrane protein